MNLTNYIIKNKLPVELYNIAFMWLYFVINIIMSSYLNNFNVNENDLVCNNIYNRVFDKVKVDIFINIICIPLLIILFFLNKNLLKNILFVIYLFTIIFAVDEKIFIYQNFKKNDGLIKISTCTNNIYIIIENFLVLKHIVNFAYLVALIISNFSFLMYFLQITLNEPIDYETFIATR